MVGEVYHWGRTFRLQKPIPDPVSLCLHTNWKYVASFKKKLSYFSSSMCAATLPTMMTMDYVSETVNKPPIKCLLLYSLPWSWCLFTARAQCL